MIEFANTIKKARLEQGKSQKQLAEELNVTQQAVQAWESGKTIPQADRIPEIAKALNVPDLLLFYNNDKQQPCIEVDITEKIKQSIFVLEEKCRLPESNYSDRIMLQLTKLYFSSHNGKCSYQIMLTEFEMNLFQTLKKLDPDYSIDDFLEFRQQAFIKKIWKR